MPGNARRLPVRGVVTAAVVLLLVAAALAVAAVASRAPDQPAVPVDLDPGPVVLIGASGLRWSDLDPDTTPALWRLVGSSAVGSLSVRTVSSSTCPLDGWLSLSAGTKATGQDVEDDRGGVNPGQPDGGRVDCGTVPPVLDGAVSGWSELVALQESTTGSYGELGSLGRSLTDAGVCSVAVGRGAAVALADRRGRVGEVHTRWAPALADRCPVAVVDAGAVSEGNGRRGDLVGLDAYVDDILDDVPNGTQVLVAGIADPSGSPAPFQVAMSVTLGEPRAAWLTSDSTRRDRLVQLIDISATITERAGAEMGLDARPWTSIEDRTLSTRETVEDLTGVSALGDVIPTDAPVFGAWVVAVPVSILIGSLGVLVVRRRLGELVTPRFLVPLACGAALFGAALPPAMYLVSVARWWQWENPALVLATVVVLVALAVALLSAVVPIRHPLRFVAIQSAITWVTLTLDGITGTPLQLGSPLAAGPVYGGRFFGFGNVTFVVYAASTFLLAAVVYQLARERRGTRAATVAVALLGLVAIVVDGWPTFGADVGGVIALVPGVVLLLLLLRQVPLTLVRGAAVIGAGVVVVGVIAFLDWLRPPAQRSHMGDFVARVVAGDFLDVIGNKLAALSASLTSPLGWAELLGFALTAAVVWRPTEMRVPELRQVFDAWPALRPALQAFLATCLLGSLVNDSGALIAGFGVLMVVPLLIATSAWSSR
jgi:hypothetical protein